MSHQNNPAKPQAAQRSIQVQQTHITGEIFQSNYPPPEMMEKYAQIDPNFPIRLLEMAEKEGEHRRKMENRVTNWAGFLDTLGSLFALSGVGGILYVGYLFMDRGHPRTGASIIIALAVAVAIAFLTRGRKSTKNLR